MAPTVFHYGKLTYRFHPDGSVWKKTASGWVEPKPHLNNAGYLSFSLGGKQSFIHRLIAFAFCENPESKPCVNHKDGNRLNNSAANLEWVTYSENMDHAYKELNFIGVLGKSLGGTGVYLDTRNGKWRARLYRFNIRKNLGGFDTKQEAEACVQKAISEVERNDEKIS